MSRLNCIAIKPILIILIAVLFSQFEATAQQAGNACLVHDHTCIYHGIGRAVGSAPTTQTAITATANWDQDNDFDLHLLAPTGPTYSDPQAALPTYPLQPTQPF